MPDPPLSPDQVAETLRALREKAELTKSAAADASGVAQSSITRYEQGRFTPDDEHMRALLDTYQSDTTTRHRMLAASRDRQPKHRRVVAHRPNADRAQREWGRLERDASRITTYSPMVIPGLLQTDGYAAALVGDALTPARRERWMAARRARRALLDEPGRGFVQITTVHALGWELGDANVMIEQLAHLAAVMDHPAVQLGIIPQPVRAGHVHAMSGFDLYTLPRGRQAIVGTDAGVSIYSDEADVAIYAQLAEKLAALAAWGEDARAELAREWYR